MERTHSLWSVLEVHLPSTQNYLQEHLLIPQTDTATLIHSRSNLNLTVQQPQVELKPTAVTWVSLHSVTLLAVLEQMLTDFVSPQTVSLTSCAVQHLTVMLADLTTSMVAHHLVLQHMLGLVGFSVWDTTDQWLVQEMSPTRLEASNHYLTPSLLQSTTPDLQIRTANLEQSLQSCLMQETHRVDSMSAQLLVSDQQWFTVSHQTPVPLVHGHRALCRLVLEQHALNVFLQHVLGLPISKTLTVETLSNTTSPLKTFQL